MLRFLVLIACAPLVVGCGGTTTRTVTTTVTRVETVEVESAAPAAVEDGGAPALATAPKRAGQVILKGEGLVSAGPKTFKAGVYSVRVVDRDPDGPQAGEDRRRHGDRDQCGQEEGDDLGHYGRRPVVRRRAGGSRLGDPLYASQLAAGRLHRRYSPSDG
jgi:hypothetical protein